MRRFITAIIIFIYYTLLMSNIPYVGLPFIENIKTEQQK